MVKILIRRTDRQGDIKVKGHAGGLNENGSDIVCAGVSTITTLFAQVLEDNPAIFVSQISLQSGDTRIKYEIHPGSEKEANTVIDTVLTGYYLLANTRPDCVYIRPQGERKKT